MKLNTATRDSMCDDLTGLLGSGTLVFYDGTPPATADTALSGNTVLATITLPATPFSAASSGTANFSGTWSTTVATGGTCTFARYFTSGAAGVAQGSVGASGSGADIILSAVVLVAAQTIDVVAASFTVPAGS